MAHFAQLDKDNKVIQVVVISNDNTLDDNGNESETVGIAFCRKLYGVDTNWVQTSYNATFRKKYAGEGDIYDKTKDVFYNESENTPPFPSWTKNKKDIWEAPKARPIGVWWRWHEDTQEWVDETPKD